MSAKKTKKPLTKSADAANNNDDSTTRNNGSGDRNGAVPTNGTVKHGKTLPLIITKTGESDQSRPTEIEPRTRRVSDVIDSMGEESCLSSSPRFKTFQEQQNNAPISPRSIVPLLPDWMAKSLEEKKGKGAETVVKKKANDSVDAGQVKKARDKTDAVPIGEGAMPYETNSDDEDEERRDVCAAMPVEKDSLEYNMGHVRRGKAIILNHTEFEMAGFSTREGSDIDAKNMAAALELLHFEVMILHNLEYSEIKKLINNLKAEDHSDADCLLVTVLSHGMKGGYVLAKDVPYPIEFLWHSFKPDVCPTLAGKPKLFFIQACRGEKLDQGVNLMRMSNSRTQTDSASSDYKIPSFADFLVAFSTVDDHYAWRNPEEGTWFIQCLCQELKESGTSVDLLKLLTRAARRVALDHQSFNDQNPLVHDMKQVPSITTMLIRDIVFRPKPRHELIDKMEVDVNQLEHA